MLRFSEPNRFGTLAARRALGERLLDTLAAIHSTGYEEVGLEGFGRPEGDASRVDLVDRYEQQTGITVGNLTCYRLLAVYRMAALGEMFFARYLMGHSDSSFHAMMEDGVPVLADQALAIAEGDRPL